MRKSIRSYIGDRHFYKMVLAIVLPIIIQNSITNFVSLLDNIMVGRLGTDPMSGVAVANQLIFVFNVTLFGAVSGAGIFAAQFHGAGNTDGVRTAFHYKLYICAGFTVTALVLLWLKGELLVGLFLNESNDPERVRETLSYGMRYLILMMLGFAPFAIVQCYASTLRECGETKLPMFASLTAVFVNLVFNYLLIFGKLGLPAMGVRGAAIATVISRYVEMGVIVIYTHRHADYFKFAHRLYSKWSIPAAQFRSITLCSLPLLANELLWSGGQSTLNQTYSLRGLDVVAATNITAVVNNLVSSAIMSLGSAAAIIIGQALGADDIERAKDHERKIIVFSVLVAIATALVMFFAAPWIPDLYSTTDTVKALSTKMIRIYCYAMPMMAFSMCCYFILRSGGKTVITFIFDSVFVWVVSIPIAMLLVRLTGLDIVPILFIVHSSELIKCIIGAVLLRKGVWTHNIVSGGMKS